MEDMVFISFNIINCKKAKAVDYMFVETFPFQP